MRLLMSLTSPFARMCRAVVIEKGLQAQVEEVIVNPYDDPQDLIAASPTGTIPALVRDDGGRPIADTRLICAWLDHLPSDRPALLPAGGVERMEARLGEALGQSLTDKSVALVMEKRRPEARRHAPHQERLSAQILRAASAAFDHVGDPDAPSTIALLTLACGLGHLDFRHPELAWREHNQRLSDWHDVFCNRQSMRATAPRE